MEELLSAFPTPTPPPLEHPAPAPSHCIHLELRWDKSHYPPQEPLQPPTSHGVNPHAPSAGSFFVYKLKKPKLGIPGNFRSAAGHI